MHQAATYRLTLTRIILCCSRAITVAGSVGRWVSHNSSLSGLYLGTYNVPLESWFFSWQFFMFCSVCGHMAFLVLPISCICTCLISFSVSNLYYRPVLMCMVLIIFSNFYLFYFHFCLFLVFSPSIFLSPGWCLPFVGIVHLPVTLFSSDERSLFSGRHSGRNYKPMTDLHAPPRLRMCGTVRHSPYLFVFLILHKTNVKLWPLPPISR